MAFLEVPPFYFSSVFFFSSFFDVWMLFFDRVVKLWSEAFTLLVIQRKTVKDHWNPVQCKLSDNCLTVILCSNISCSLNSFFNNWSVIQPRGITHSFDNLCHYIFVMCCYHLVQFPSLFVSQSTYISSGKTWQHTISLNDFIIDSNLDPV